MACIDAYINRTKSINETESTFRSEHNEDGSKSIHSLKFGVDSKVRADNYLQNNLTEFEWVTRNKLYPIFWARNIVGDNCLTNEEIDFLHGKACRIAPMYISSATKETEEQGIVDARESIGYARGLGIPINTAIFLEIDEAENATTDYMKGYIKTILLEGFTPAFKANTDASVCSFDREFSRGMQTDKELFDMCLIWAVAPIIEEYDKITTSHLIHPDNWVPFAPSAITRKDIAIWQYGQDCHPIEDNFGNKTTFNLNLVRNEQVLIRKTF